MGAGVLGLAMGYKQVPREPFPPDTRGYAAVSCAPAKATNWPSWKAPPVMVIKKIDSGMRIVAGGWEEEA